MNFKLNRTVIIAIFSAITLILLAVLVIKFLGKDTNNPKPPATTSPKPTSTGPGAAAPVMITQNEEEEIKIEYYPTTSIIYVSIEAQSKDQYKERVKKAMQILKDSGFDPCDKKIFWLTPPNLKKVLSSDDSKELHDITCPTRTLPATSSAKP